MEQNLLYHYTSIDVLKCLLEKCSNTNQILTFWASNCAFMNDPNEIKEGIRLITNSMETFECPILRDDILVFLNKENFAEYLLYSSSFSNKISIPYAISFSNIPNNLTMWSMYGDNGKGVMLGFNRNELENCNDNYNLIDCIYSNQIEQSLQQTVTKLVQHAFSNTQPRPDNISRKQHILILISQIAAFICPYIKNQAYKYEEETRLIINTNTPKFRVTKNTLVPYTEVNIPLSSLKSIMLGPTCDGRNIYSLKLLALQLGLDELFDNIIQSDLPYKN